MKRIWHGLESGVRYVNVYVVRFILNCRPTLYVYSVTQQVGNVDDLLSLLVGLASGRSHVVTAEDLELHNQAGGAWSVINGKVYDLGAVAADVRTFLFQSSFSALFLTCLFCFSF